MWKAGVHQGFDPEPCGEIGGLEFWYQQRGDVMGSDPSANWDNLSNIESSPNSVATLKGS